MSKTFGGLPPQVLFALLITGFVHGESFHAQFSQFSAGLDGLVQIICLATLAAALLKFGSRPRAGFLLGLSFGLGWFLNATGWVYISMHQYGGMPSILAGAATGLFALYLAIYCAIACALLASPTVQRTETLGYGLGFMASFASLITLAELARGYVFTGFPWAVIGYAHVDSPLGKFAAWIGVYGISWLAALVSAGLAYALAPHFRGASRKEPVAMLVAVLLALGIGSQLVYQEHTRASGRASVSLVQPAIEQSMKFRPDTVVSNLETLLQLSEQGKGELLILPETAWPVSFGATPQTIYQRIANLLNQKKVIAVGLPYREVTDGKRWISNSVVWLSNRSHIGMDSQPSVVQAPRYDKHHLVPFGEFIPWGFGWFVAMMDMPLGSFNRGELGSQKPFEHAGLTWGFNICYEDLFGEEIAKAGSNAQVLVNVSNLAWFGRSKAIPQHLQIARMRTLETQRPMLRATNTGATAAIDASGKVVGSLVTDQAGVLETSVEGRTGMTPYMRWFNTPVVVVCLGSLLALVGATWRRRNQVGNR